MSWSHLPTPPDRSPPPGLNPYRQRSPSESPVPALKPWLRNPSLTMRLGFAREELEQFIYSHDEYLNDYHMAHERIHTAYAIRRTLENARYQIRPAIYDSLSRELHQQQDLASDMMREMRENVRVLRKDIKRMQETVVALEKQWAAEKSGVVINAERATQR